jgi:hypothetical protein
VPLSRIITTVKRTAIGLAAIAVLIYAGDFVSIRIRPQFDSFQVRPPVLVCSPTSAA